MWLGKCVGERLIFVFFPKQSDLIVSNKSDKSTEFLHKYNITSRHTIDKGGLTVEQTNTQCYNDQTQLVDGSRDTAHLTLQQFITMEGRLPMRSATSGQQCSACHTGKANNPQQASCGHICCTPCWMDRFKVSQWSLHQQMVLFQSMQKADKSCPNCGKKILKLKRDLTKLYLS